MNNIFSCNFKNISCFTVFHKNRWQRFTYHHLDYRNLTNFLINAETYHAGLNHTNRLGPSRHIQIQWKSMQKKSRGSTISYLI